MNFKSYQVEARKTAIYPIEHAIIYPALGLAGEAGETCEKIKKMLRDDRGKLTDERKQEIIKELGDALWYISNMCSDLKINMNDVAKANIKKLKSRQERGRLQGSGDKR